MEGTEKSDSSYYSLSYWDTLPITDLSSSFLMFLHEMSLQKIKATMCSSFHLGGLCVKYPPSSNRLRLSDWAAKEVGEF